MKHYTEKEIEAIFDSLIQKTMPQENESFNGVPWDVPVPVDHLLVVLLEHAKVSRMLIEMTNEFNNAVTKINNVLKSQ